MNAKEYSISSILDYSKSLLPAMKKCIFVWKDRIALASGDAIKALGWQEEDFTGKSLQDLLDEPDCTALTNLIASKVTLNNFRTAFKRRDNSLLPVECDVLFPEYGKNTLAVIAFHVLKPEKDKALSFKHIFESNMFGMVYADIYNRIYAANDVFLDMVGYSREEIISGEVGWRGMSPQETASLNELAIQQLKEYGAFQPHERQFIRKDGSLVDALVGGLMEEGTSDRAICFVVDISAKKRAERAAFKGEELFRIMADSSSALIWFITPDFKVHYMNKTALEYFGCRTIEQFPPKWEVVIYPDDLSVLSERMRNAFEQRIRFESIHRVRHVNGQYRWHYATGAPVFSDNEFLGYVGTDFDVNDLKEAQAQLMQYSQKLEQSNKELEHFATIASHDLQEPLRKVRIFCDHLTEITRGALGGDALDDLERIQHNTARMQNLIEDLLDLSRIHRQGKPFRKVKLGTLVEEIIAELRYSFPDARNRVEVHGTMTIECDSNQMSQMLTQLLDNGLKFHKPGQPSHVNVLIQPHDDNLCRLSISDNGIGMKPEYLDRIFDTFTRLHHEKEYPGTGIGLTLAKKIIERHHGSITVNSTPGKGSDFIVLLPVAQTGNPD